METAILEKAQNLLSIASNVLHYEEALTKASGESFNIFNILHVAHYEVRTHSPMLAELLNPTGSHGQGAIFLRHFCTGLGIQNFDAESARVRTEYHIGPQTAEEGGRIDILISDKNRCHIIIENKIYAGEQPNQLGRYRKHSPGAHLFFLTLFGGASQDAVLSNSLEVKNISYTSDILLWLEKCRKEAANAPIVRETITQYIHLIQQLTHQNTNTRMSQELTNAVLRDPPTYLAYVALCKADRQIHASILAKLKKDIMTSANEMGLELNFPDSDLANRYDGFYFTSPAMDEQKVRISFQFSEKNRCGCIFGFSRLAANSICPMEDKLFDAFKSSFPQARKSPAWWGGLTSWDQYSQWGETTMAAIQFGNFSTELGEILKEMVGIFKKAIQVPDSP